MRLTLLVGTVASLALAGCQQASTDSSTESGPSAAAEQGVPAGAIPSGPEASPVADPGFRPSLRQEIDRYKARLSCDIETSEERGDPPAPAVLCAGIEYVFVVTGDPQNRTDADGSPVIEVRTESRADTPLYDNVVRELAAWYGFDLQAASDWYAGDRSTPLAANGYVMQATDGPDIAVRRA